VRFGRKSASTGDEVSPAHEEEAGGPSADAPETAVGPFDASEVDTEDHPGIDLGSLLVTPVGPMEMQLQVEEESGEVIAVVLVGEEGALELRAFAASRGGGAWDELRPRISAEMARLGGTSDEKQGSFGTELLCMVPVQTPEGQAATQASRIVGHEGPAWLLRATIMGPAALDPELGAPFEETIRQVVVRRGRGAMPPGAPLRLTLPHDAQPIVPEPGPEEI
jgi:hypothetical protein